MSYASHHEASLVVLDGHALNPGDLSWAALERRVPTRVHDRTPDELIVARAQTATMLLTNKTRLDRQVLQQLPRLRYVGVLATGYDVVDVQAARELGIVVTNVPAYSTASVAQMTFALLLELTHHVGKHWESARSGRWTQSGDFAHWETPLVELSGRVLGVVGYGRIGRAVAGIGSAFGMRIIAAESDRWEGAEEPVDRVSLDHVFAEADVVTLHCPLDEGTRGLVNADRLSRMKKSAFLVNTSRGGLIDEAALLQALRTEQIEGAALDVLIDEPPALDHPLLAEPRCIVTPHIAWASRAARERLLSIAADNIRAFFAGSPRNVVS